MPVLIPSRRDKATTFESLLARGITTLQLDERTERRCSNCGQPFLGIFMAEIQTVCPGCIESSVRMTQAESRAARLEERKRRMASIGLEGKLLGMTFATFARDEQPIASDEAWQFFEQWPNVQALALLGERGTGKTHLATAILHALSDGGIDGHYVHLPSLASDLAMANDWQDASTRLFVPLYKTACLVLDDAGRERNRPDSAWPQMLDTLIDRRSIGGYPTVICANLTSAELARWLGDAGASRFLSVAHLVDMTPGDRRFTPALGSVAFSSTRDPLVACPACQGAGWVLDATFRAGNTDRLMKCRSCDGAGF